MSIQFYKKIGILGKLDIYFVGFVLLIRVILNFGTDALSIFFMLANLILFFMLMFKKNAFSIIFILFITIDSMIGTYLATKSATFDWFYFGTMAINLLMIFLVVLNKHNKFPTYRS